jgi:transposase, IS6 family
MLTEGATDGSYQNVVNPHVINVDKSPTFPPTLSELQEEDLMPKKTRLRAIKYLNNAMENDHKFTKCKSRYRQWYQSFKTAKRAISGMETMRMVQKGQMRYAPKGDVRAQNALINQLFNMAA